MPCTPTLVGPVSTLLRSVRVTGALPGAEVVVSSIGPNARDVARGPAAGGDDRVPLLPGEALRGDDRLVARQSVGGQTSATTPADLALGVQAAPTAVSQIGAVGLRSHLYECGRHVWVVGAIPGADVSLLFAGAVRARGQALEDGARLALSDGMHRNSPVEVQQVVPPLGSGPFLTVRPDPAPTLGDRRLPAPTIKPPLFGCQPAVLVSGVVDGATVTLRHASGAVDAAGFDLPALWFRVAPLRAGDRLVPRQELTGCEIQSDDGAVVTVEPARPTAPRVAPPCAGAPIVQVADLLPGAIVRIKVGGKEFAGMAPPDRPAYPFEVDPLPASGTVTVTQELCGVTSPATSAPISAHEDVTRPVTIVRPLVACAGAVSVTGAHDGAQLEVVARDPRTGVEAPISRRVPVHGTRATIDVAPFLADDQVVSVLQWACSTRPTRSAAVEVRPHGTPAPPKPLGVVPGFRADVVDAIPGAWVEVEVMEREQWRFAGAEWASAEAFPVPLNRELKLGDFVRARQTLCEHRSEPGREVQVIRPLPQPPVLDEPPNDVSGLGLRPLFRWHDPAPTGPGKADSFTITIWRQRAVAMTASGLTATSFQPPSDLLPNTVYTWAVIARNTTGASAHFTRVFGTGAAPPPPKPQLDAYDVATKTLTGRSFTPNAAVTVRLSMIGSGIVNSYGAFVEDIREGMLQTRADASGRIRVVVDPTTLLTTLFISDVDGTLIGVLRGEAMSFTATDGRFDPNGFDRRLWSDPLVKLVP